MHVNHCAQRMSCQQQELRPIVKIDENLITWEVFQQLVQSACSHLINLTFTAITECHKSCTQITVTLEELLEATILEMRFLCGACLLVHTDRITCEQLKFLQDVAEAYSFHFEFVIDPTVHLPKRDAALCTIWDTYNRCMQHLIMYDIPEHIALLTRIKEVLVEFYYTPDETKTAVLSAMLCFIINLEYKLSCWCCEGKQCWLGVVKQDLCLILQILKKHRKPCFKAFSCQKKCHDLSKYCGEDLYGIGQRACDCSILTILSYIIAIRATVGLECDESIFQCCDHMHHTVVGKNFMQGHRCPPKADEILHWFQEIILFHTEGAAQDMEQSVKRIIGKIGEQSMRDKDKVMHFCEFLSTVVVSLAVSSKEKLCLK